MNQTKIEIESYEYSLIVDLEATCCDKKSIPRHEMEIIEIGAVMVNNIDQMTVDEFTTFIKPIRYSKLTHFCTELTSITQTDVDRAPGFVDAVMAFKEWVYKYENFIFCSWGDYDKNQLQQDSDFHGIPNPLGGVHVNIKKRFSETQNLPKKNGMAGALKMCDINLEGTHHRGIDDAKNMANLMPYIIGKKMLNRIES